MQSIEPIIAFLQYSAQAPQSGSLPMAGILIGIVAGFVAAAGGRSGGKWGAIAGSCIFAIAYAVNQPEGFDAGGFGRITQPLFMQVIIGAVSGAVWCGLWGLLGGVVGRKVGADSGGQSGIGDSASRAGQPPRQEADLCGECGATIAPDEKGCQKCGSSLTVMLGARGR